MTVEWPTRLKSLLTRLAGDRSGISLVYVTVMLPVLIGFSLIAIDGGRLWSLHSSLQNGADALALAGAAELDRRPDSIVRADRAVANLLSNSTIFAESVAVVDGSVVTTNFYAALPPNDADPMTTVPALNKSDPVDSATARFIEVIVDPVNFRTVLPASFIGGSDTTQANATAVAGFDAAVCNFTPMFMCNPFEPAGNTDVMRSTEIFSHIASEAQKRKLIEFKRIGPSGQWAPGNYGFLEAPLGPGANALGETIAAVTPSACFVQNGVYTKPGNTAVAKDAFNVRFDIYKGSYNKNTAAYRPSLNVRKGYKPGNGSPSACNRDPSADPVADQVMALRRDSCFATGTCSNGNRIGNGDWDQDNSGTPDYEEYWSINHGSYSRPRPPGTSNSNLPSRYTVYRYEIDNNYVSDTSPAPGSESGAPACYNGSTTPSDTPDRRILYGAIMNCIAQPIDSGNSGGPYVPVAFAKFFITEPMDGPHDSLWVEMIDVVEPGNSQSIARDVVQLYR